MIQNIHKYIAGLLLLCWIGVPLLAQENAMQAMGKANAKVAKASSRQNRWEGPKDGPKLQSKKRIVFIGADMRDSVLADLYKGAKEAGAIGGWEVLLIDCRGACYQGAPVLVQALNMKPDGIVLAGVDISTQSKGLEKAIEKKVPIVGWHALSKPGAVEGFFAEIGNDAREAGQIAALLGATEASSRMGMVILTDSTNPYSSVKSAAAVELIKQCENCRLLSVEELPAADAATKLQPLMEDLVKRFGSRWTHVLAVNDSYFDVMEKPAIASAIAGNKLRGISAGDGTTSAYQRMHGKGVQFATVPEPATLQGYQLIDELNRALSGAQPSGFVMPVHLVSDQNIAFDGGAKNEFDPENDYRNQYKKIWLGK